MARPRSRHQRERRARFWKGLFKFVVFLGLIGATAYYAYEAGTRLSAQEIADLKSEITRLSESEQAQLTRSQELESLLTEARQTAEDYRLRYEEVAPAAVQEVLSEVREKMNEGLSADRLAFVVSQAHPPRECSDTETRRFIAKTENYDGANTWVRFDDAITVSGTGAAANEGREQWFDPAEPVTMTFTPLGEDAQTVQGELPLQHSMVFKGKEYRFTAAPGSRGFIEVTADWCDYSAG
ncbi:hypothetical protein C882_1418 [Caenispirillum salinarum AK4]|uniref:Uncharacterized protein n=1 Tax=Caenispirillum salinarum AK4 TaxID=1238182 RepID=K9GR05_9PROT|nr:hypothetical protein [Caenispirillum salinarum]EKV27572.1 hypothetical protein C882_1418 [Caenispirillum salinarum AK4]